MVYGQFGLYKCLQCGERATEVPSIACPACTELNSKMLNILDALEQRKVVLAQMAGRHVTVNSLSKGPGREWAMKWSHEDYYHARVNYVDENTQFFIK